MKLAIDIVQIVVSILLMVSILLQQRGEGLGAVFGGGSTIASTRRGAEKGLFIISIILAVIFLAIALARMFIR